jgi:hypothetical protein
MGGFDLQRRNTGLNEYWNPLYSWILAAFFRLLDPPAYWQVAVLHAVNFAAFCAALDCFELFLSDLLRCRQGTNQLYGPRLGATVGSACGGGSTSDLGRRASLGRAVLENRTEVDSFWAAPKPLRAHVLELFRKVVVSIVVAETLRRRAQAEGWN